MQARDSRLVGWLIVAAFHVVVLGGGSVGRAGEASALAAALESIRSPDLRDHAAVLANDTFEGREAGTRGGHAAAGYIVQQLKKLELKPGGSGGSFFQGFGNQFRNILAVWEGSDPELKAEVVLVGAHYDHVGYGTSRNSYGPTGFIHNGADDNASGASGLLEVVEALARYSPRPKRSILICFWDAEEKGLLGSKHWVANPTVPLGNVKLAVNMDMIGRLRRPLEVMGTRTRSGLRRLISRANETVDLPLDFAWKIESNSDHYSFFEKQLPILQIHTGLHGDYHRPSDDVEKLNVEGMQQVARLVFSVVFELADEEASPPFRQAVRRETSAAQRTLEQPLPAPTPRLGLRWNFDGEPGLVATEVDRGWPAWNAGIRVGDRLLRFAGQELSADTDFRGLVLAARNPVALTFLRRGEETAIETAVELAGEPVRWGVAWREDEAEPASVVLVQVVPGSPADRGGLRWGDRILEVAGREFQGSDEFQRLVRAAGNPLELLMEREGRLQRVALTLPVLDAPAAQGE